MKDFQFRTPGTTIFRPGSSIDRSTYEGLGISGKTLLVTDNTLNTLGIASKVESAIKEADIDVVMFDAVEPEPNIETVRKLVDLATKENINSVIGLGGGSPMDVAKIVALLIPCPQPIESLYGVGNAKGVRLPLILIPTTAGTGSEATPVAVVTGDDGEKSPIVGPQFICDSVILDAELTLGLPPKITAATGVDAMVHAIEAYTSSVRKNTISDKLAINSLQLLHKSIKISVMQGDDVEARSNMLLGAMMAGLAFANSSVGAVHALAYPLGTNFHLSHGESNAMVLTSVMRFNLSHATSLYADLSRSIIPEAIHSTDLDASELLINELSELIVEVGLKDRLSEFGISKNDLIQLTDGALNQARLLSYNIKEMSRDDIYNVFNAVL